MVPAQHLSGACSELALFSLGAEPLTPRLARRRRLRRCTHSLHRSGGGGLRCQLCGDGCVGGRAAARAVPVPLWDALQLQAPPVEALVTAVTEHLQPQRCCTHSSVQRPGKANRDWSERPAQSAPGEPMIKASLPTANASSLSEAGAGGLTISASYSPLLHTVHASVSSGFAPSAAW
jgi:hypothetical protein